MAERPAPGASGSPPAESQPTHGGPPEGAAAQPGSVVLGQARYVALTAEQEREAIAALEGV
jgi:hypothetical protein